MKWAALIPIKAGDNRKTRLSPILAAGERRALTERMLRHVVGVVTDFSRIGHVHVLTPERDLAQAPSHWIEDRGGGLNAVLAKAIAELGPIPLVIVHADLPLLAAADLEALIDAATIHRCAFAPDRHGAGTNAVAIMDCSHFIPSFGAGSLARHRAAAEAAGLDPAIIERRGLATDVDLPQDLAEAIRQGAQYLATD